MDSDFYTVEIVAEKLGIAVRTVRNKINKGEIPAHKFGGRWYVIHSELVEAIRKESKK